MTALQENLCFCSKRVLAGRMGCSPHTLKAIRQRGEWIEGLHFVRENSRVVRYNLNLCLDWLAHRGDPLAHQRTIEAYVLMLASQQKKTRRGASKNNRNG